MNSKLFKPLVAGLIATTIMTIVMFTAPLMGLPKMNVAAMLSMMMGVPLVIGWIMHYMIGTIFAFGYSLFFQRVLHKISNNILKGTIYGFIVFVFAQIALSIMGLIFPMQAMGGNVILMMSGSLIGHLVFGIGVSLVVKETYSEKVNFVK